MTITDIKIRKLFHGGNVLALVSIALDDEFAVHDIKVIQGAERMFVAMPSRRGNDGVFRDVAHPISAQTRQRMEQQILEAYQRYVAEQAAQEVPAAQ